MPNTSPGEPDRLSAMAHPLRSRLIFELREGPATAAELARRTDQTRGNASYHLRALEAAGLVSEEPDRGTERERWWRLAHLPEVEVDELTSPAQAGAAALALGQERGRRLADFAAGAARGELGQARAAAARVSEAKLALDADQQLALVAELDAVVERWEQLAAAAPVPEDGQIVELQLSVFSRRATS